VTFVLILAILMIVACAYLVAQLVTLPARQRQASVGRASAYADREPQGVEQEVTQRPPRFHRVNSLVARATPPAMLESIEERLAEAGLARRFTPTGFVLGKVGMGIVGLVLGAYIGSASGNGFRAFIFGLGLGALLFILPDRILAGRVKTRKDRLEADLPSAIDLLAICVEAGMSLDGAMSQLVDHMDGPLADEFSQTLGEIRAGEARSDALRRLAERANVPSMTALVRAIIQSDQQGIPLGRVLRIQARDTRIARQQEAEERAAKMPVKMLLPTAIFIFPVLFFVVVGPAVIELSKVF
jgi:tight adherence protein C